MAVKTIEWADDKVRLIDQTLLPEKVRFLEISDYQELGSAIKRLSIRGAPAIGIAAAYGVVLGLRHSKAYTFEEFYKETEIVLKYLASTRPTAVNLFWALERMKKVITRHKDEPIADINAHLLQEAHEILKSDEMICKQIGENGFPLIGDGTSVLTHCNAGGLATGNYGTALSVIYVAQEKGKKLHVYADETRPLMQGSRLTAWELKDKGIEVTVICDNMAAYVMKQGKVDLIVVGADRIAANGDVANKIGTYGLAVLAREHKVPFYVAAPCSTFDLSLSSGEFIPIEERNAKEITHNNGKAVVPDEVKVYNPAFDVTEAEYITAIITENGVIHKPSKETVAEVVITHVPA